MNYRHAFHAGNFADVVKHAALLQLLARMRRGGALTVIDTHAGRGMYDLEGPDARRSAEAEAGIARLMAAEDAPEAFDPLKRAVRALNSDGRVRRYPGSPWLIAEAIGPDDRYVACELHPEDYAALASLLRARRNVRTLCLDGYQAALAQAPADGPAVALIDPPFERADDYRRSVEAVAALRRKNPRLVALIWLPLKDLETFDAFLRDLEDGVDAPALVAETRIRPLLNPLRMNGCALVLVGGPKEVRAPLEEACRWTAERLGEEGMARIYEI